MKSFFKVICLGLVFSCATRGLKLSEQIPSMHPQFKNEKVLSFVEKDEEIAIKNLIFISEEKEKFLKGYFKTKNTRNIASAEPEYEFTYGLTSLTVNKNVKGVVLNDVDLKVD